MILFIVNPISGVGSKTRVVSRLEKKDCRVVYTEYAGHAEKLAREAEEDIVVAVGGDGTVNEVARGLLGTGKTLGIIPRGSGDGLALHLGLSHDIIRNLRTIEAGKTRLLDAATINGRYFFSVCGVGLDAIVSERFAKSGKRGLMNYIDIGLKTWREYKPQKHIVEIDGQSFEMDASLITVGNSSQWGNNARIAPRADIDDGILDMTAVDRVSALEMPTLALQLMTGTLNWNSKVHCYRGRHIRISRPTPGPAHADGEWFSAGNDLEISILPQSLNVIVP